MNKISGNAMRLIQLFFIDDDETKHRKQVVNNGRAR